MRNQFDRQVAHYMIANIVHNIRLSRLKGDTRIQQKLENDLNRMFANRHRVGYTKTYDVKFYW